MLFHLWPFWCWWPRLNPHLCAQPWQARARHVPTTGPAVANNNICVRGALQTIVGALLSHMTTVYFRMLLLWELYSIEQFNSEMLIFLLDTFIAWEVVTSYSSSWLWHTTSVGGVVSVISMTKWRSWTQRETLVCNTIHQLTFSVLIRLVDVNICNYKNHEGDTVDVVVGAAGSPRS